MMGKALLFILIGYLSGSVLYAKVWGKLLCGTDITQGSTDGNPGTANAFVQGGFWCGVLTLFCELLKGILPVYFYMKGTGPEALPDGWTALSSPLRYWDIPFRCFKSFMEERALRFPLDPCWDYILIGCRY